MGNEIKEFEAEEIGEETGVYKIFVRKAELKRKEEVEILTLNSYEEIENLRDLLTEILETDF